MQGALSLLYNLLKLVALRSQNCNYIKANKIANPIEMMMKSISQAILLNLL